MVTRRDPGVPTVDVAELGIGGTAEMRLLVSGVGSGLLRRVVRALDEDCLSSAGGFQ
jgi:hypothetical protein